MATFLANELSKLQARADDEKTNNEEMKIRIDSILSTWITWVQCIASDKSVQSVQSLV